MLKAIRVSVMLLALVGTAYAGEVLTPPAPQPPPTNAAATTSLIQTVVAVIVSILP